MRYRHSNSSYKRLSCSNTQRGAGETVRLLLLGHLPVSSSFGSLRCSDIRRLLQKAGILVVAIAVTSVQFIKRVGEPSRGYRWPDRPPRVAPPGSEGAMATVLATRRTLSTQTWFAEHGVASFFAVAPTTSPSAKNMTACLAHLWRHGRCQLCSETICYPVCMSA